MFGLLPQLLLQLLLLKSTRGCLIATPSEIVNFVSGCGIDGTFCEKTPTTEETAMETEGIRVYLNIDLSCFDCVLRAETSSVQQRRGQWTVYVHLSRQNNKDICGQGASGLKYQSR